MRRDLTEGLQNGLAGSRLVRGLADGIKKIVDALFRPAAMERFKHFLNGTWQEHPLHPVLTDVPIGAWTGVILLYIFAFVFGLRGLGPAIGVVNGLGILAGLAAVFAGLADWMDTGLPEFAVGVFHGLNNIVATLVMILSFIILAAQGWWVTWGSFIPAIVGYLMAAFGAFLGGALVYRMGVMINRDAYQSGPKDFVPVLPLERLPENTPVRVDAHGRPVMLVRRGDRIFAMSAVCTHLACELDEGKIIGDVIECPCHVSRFRLEDGKVMGGPATAPTVPYEARVAAGTVEVRQRK